MRDRVFLGRMGRGLTALVVVAVSAGLVGVPAAGADPVQAGSPHGMIPPQKFGATVGFFPQLQLRPQFYPLQYFGGPVLRTNETFAIFWDPSGGGAFPPGYQDLIVRYLQDVAADSGKSNVYSVLNQHYDTTGPIAYDSTFAGSAIDTDPIPTGCPTSPQLPTCFTDQQLAGELDSFLSANNIARPANRQFLVFTPPGVSTCFDSSGRICSGNIFCAYHGGFTGGHGPALYSNLPFPTPACDFLGQHPNGSVADATIDFVSHEMKETIDDPGPSPGWRTPSGGLESSDLCAFYFGPVRSNGVGDYNQVINGHDYLLQAEFSNTLALPQGFGCVTSGSDQAPPTAAFSAMVPPVGSVAHLDASASSEPDPGDSISSYFWRFGDGTAGPTTGAVTHHTFPSAGTYHVQLWVTDNHGATATIAHDVTVGAPNPTVPFRMDLTERADELGPSISGSGNATRLGTVTEQSLGVGFDTSNFPASFVEFALLRLSDNSGKNSLFVWYEVTLTDTANPPQGNNYALAGNWSIAGGTGNLSNSFGSGTISGTCTSSFTSPIVNCANTWNGQIGPPP